MPNDMELITHAVPTDPGRCRMIFTFVLPKSRLKGIASLLVKLKLSKWLLWLDHFNRNAVSPPICHQLLHNCFMMLLADLKIQV